MRIVDLSVEIRHQFPCDPPSMYIDIDYVDHKKGAEEMKPYFEGITEQDLPNGLGWAIERIKIETHNGTHLDAPWHYHPTTNNGEPAKTIDEIPLEWCFGDGVMLDFSHFPDGYIVTPADMEAELDRINYKIKPFDIVLIQSGAQRHWGTPAYINSGCGMGKESTLYLLNQGAKIVGTDAWSWDRPLSFISKEFAQTKDPTIIWEGHFAGIEKEYCHLEKLTNLDKLPPFGFKVACFPIKIHKASAGWTRAVAMFS